MIEYQLTFRTDQNNVDLSFDSLTNLFVGASQGNVRAELLTLKLTPLPDWEIDIQSFLGNMFSKANQKSKDYLLRAHETQEDEYWEKSKHYQELADRIKRWFHEH